MKEFVKLKPSGIDYLVIPAMPTPNGRLHLGHMSGPYLKMDVLTRAQRRNGNKASIISGCDAYESYVPLKAWLSGKSELEVCNYYSDWALKDLKALNIHYDNYVNPIDPAVKEVFIEHAYQYMHDLEKKGLIAKRPEKFLYSPSSDRYIVGCWLLGNCPVCHAESGSYQCENCGNQYRPMDILEPHPRSKETDLVEIDDFALYLKINKKAALWSHIDKMNIAEPFKNIVEEYFLNQGDYIRLTNPDHWGIKWAIEGSKIPNVIYSATFMNVYAVYMGEMYKEMYGTELNPFHPESTVKTVCSFGIDCVIPYILGLTWGIESSAFKPMDFLLPNYFCNLEDSKFSTSREHAIWGEDIVKLTPLSSDSVRYYLTLINPESETTSFSISHLLEVVNQTLADRVTRTLRMAWEKSKGVIDKAAPSFPFEQLENLLILQLDALTPPTFKMAKSLEPIHKWLDLAQELIQKSPADAYWWLKGFVLLAYPIMPDCAQSIWGLLGHDGNPSENQFFQTPNFSSEGIFPTYFPAAQYDQIKHVLPKSLLMI